MWLSSFLYLVASGTLTRNDTTEDNIPQREDEFDFGTERLNFLLREEFPDSMDYVTETTEMLQRESLASSRVDSFHLCLITYVNGTSFDTESFTRDSSNLFKTFAEIVILVEDIPLCNDMINRLRYTQHMFRVMVVTSRGLEAYNLMGGSKQNLVYCVIEMSAMFLAMYDSKGIPNVHMPQYAYKMNKFSETITMLNIEFRKLTDVPFELQAAFKKHMMMAQREFNVLESYRPFLTR